MIDAHGFDCMCQWCITRRLVQMLGRSMDLAETRDRARAAAEQVHADAKVTQEQLQRKITI